MKITKKELAMMRREGRCGWALQHATEELQANESIVRKAIKQEHYIEIELALILVRLNGRDLFPLQSAIGELEINTEQKKLKKTS